MKWILGLTVLIGLMSSCNNDLVVIDEWKDIPVVWGLLSKSDTAHYIRLEKAFLDPTTSALDIARIPDSLYYDDAQVSLRRVATNQVFSLTRVDGDLEGYPREGGIFAETPNYLYKIHASMINLVIGEEYELIINRGDGTAPVTATTEIVAKPDLRNPTKGSMLSLRPKFQFNITWTPAPQAAIYDLQMRFHYREKSPATNDLFVPRSFHWTLVRNYTSANYELAGTDFYNTIRANIAEDLEATRRFDSLDIIIWAGGQELADFIKLTQANTGITSTQDIPEYTNMSEGIGIFSSRNVSFNTGFRLNEASLDSLSQSVITEHLNFE